MRVSLPISTAGWPPLPDRTLPAAYPSRSTKSGVIGLCPTVPRTPSVPKCLRLMASLVAPCYHRSAFARRLVESLLHRREQVLKDRARAEMNFSGDLHAGLQRIAPAVGRKLLARKLDQGAERRGSAGSIASRRRVHARRRRVRCVRAHVDHIALDHAVLLE